MSALSQIKNESRVNFAVVCPAWESEAWARRCLESIKRQTYPHFQCIYVDANSTDDTYAVARRTVSGDQRFTIVRNEVRQYPLANIVYGTNQVAQNPNDVIVIVDGDDWLKHDRVFEEMAKIYSDPGVWITYGNHEFLRRSWRQKIKRRRLKGVHEYPWYVSEYGLYRHYPFFCAGHLRTYRKFLFDSIRDEDLRDDDGDYFWGGGDAATMYPMLEMATAKHARYIDEVLYVYNNDHGLSEMRPETRDRKNLVKMKIQALRKYKPLIRE